MEQQTGKEDIVKRPGILVVGSPGVGKRTILSICDGSLESVRRKYIALSWKCYVLIARALCNGGYLEELKELEAQLLVDRKLARQNVDTKIAEPQQQQMRQQFEDQNDTHMRPPLVAKPLTLMKNTSDHTGIQASNLFHFPSDHNHHKTPSGQRIPISTNPTRNSLIPLPSILMTAHQPSMVLPLLPALEDDKDEKEKHCSPEAAIYNPIALKNGAKKLNSILRRSLHK